MNEVIEEKKVHKCLVLLPLIVASELAVNSANSPMGIGAKFTEVTPGEEIELEKNEAIRLEKMGTIEILDKPEIPSPEEVESKEAENRLEKIIQVKLATALQPLQEQLVSLSEENAKLKEELNSKKK